LEQKQLQHLNHLYDQVQQINTWFLQSETVDWKPLTTEAYPNSILVNWPRVFGEQLVNTTTLPVDINGEQFILNSRDFVKNVIFILFYFYTFRCL
jgi:hypothetical protein